jgi:hypothetical protein
LVNYAASQFYINANHVSQWRVGIYLLVYFLGGIAIAWVSYHLLYNFDINFKLNITPTLPYPDTKIAESKPKKKNNFTRQIGGLLVILIGIAAVLFFFAPNSKVAWINVLKSLSWTLCSLVLWYGIISPLFIKLVGGIAKQQKNKAVSDIISFLPVLRQLSWAIWQQSKAYKGNRILFFVSTLLHATLTYTNEDNPNTKL